MSNRYTELQASFDFISEPRPESRAWQDFLSRLALDLTHRYRISTLSPTSLLPLHRPEKMSKTDMNGVRQESSDDVRGTPTQSPIDATKGNTTNGC